MSGRASSGTPTEPEPIDSVSIQVGNLHPTDASPPTPISPYSFSANVSVSGVGRSQVKVTAIDGVGVSISEVVPITLVAPVPPPPPPVDTTGQLTFIKVSDGLQKGFNFAQFGLLKMDGGGETVFEFGHSANAPDWIIHAAELAMLREALVRKLQVTITHDRTSNVPMVVKVKAPP